MIKFDSNSIYERALEKLQQNPDWRVIANNSVVSSILRSNAEVMAETARYAEYLFKESKWDTAQNPNSILAMANMLGYQARRKVAASGQIYISCDPRTHLVGKTINASTFLATSKNPRVFENSSAWLSSNTAIKVDSSVIITDSKGNPYIARSKTLNKGSTYEILDVIQGKRASKFIDINTIRSLATKSKLDPYLYIPVTIQDCEDARTPNTRPYFSVYVIKSRGVSNTLTSESNVTSTEYRVVDSLLLSSSSDKDVEVYNDLYDQSFFYLKFNNDPSRGSVLDLSSNTNILGIGINYVVSKGDEGNLTKNFETFSLVGTKGEKLYGVNLNPIIGGLAEETVTSIKANAPKEYIKYYTAGTKEAYTNTILNTTFSIPTKSSVVQLVPKNVRVYGGYETDTTTNTKIPITNISIISDNINQIINEYDTDYSKISNALNYYLDKIKSPQDVLRFVAPNMTRIALGWSCNINSSIVDDSDALTENIRKLIASLWGADSSNLDFDRSFSEFTLNKAIEEKFPNMISGANLEMEAVQKLNWSDATYRDPRGTNTLHTIRFPFAFNKIFLGNTSNPGFKDFRVSASYVMRIDVMYKKPLALRTSIGNSEYHKVIFIKEDKDARTSSNEAIGFYHVTNSSNIWPSDITTSTEYTDELSGKTNLEESLQFDYSEELFSKVYTNTEFNELSRKVSAEEKSVSSTDKTSYIKDYLVYYSGNHTVTNNTFGDGYIEFSFDPFFKVLQEFSNYDANMTNASVLTDTNLAILKCNSSSDTSVFSDFKDLARDYIDIYVSMRPIDTELTVSSQTDTDTDCVVLYADTTDSTNNSDIAAEKLSRMIAVNCRGV